MKKPATHKDDPLSAVEHLALCAITAAFRPYQRCKFFALALVVPAADAEIYRMATEAFLNPSARRSRLTANNPAILKSNSIDTATSRLNELLRQPRTLIVVEAANLIPESFNGVFDLVTEVVPPTARQIKGVLRRLYRIEISDDHANLMQSTELDRLRNVMRRGRPLHRVIAALRPKTETPREKPSDEPTELRLETLSGFGDAKEWGINLATDIEGWRNGTIGWHDVDKGLLISGPPGTGKTIYAQALAATCGVKLVYSSAARWQAEGHLGSFLRGMRSSFDEARDAAPSILFIDEVDSFGDREGAHGDHANYIRYTINGLLECLDGVQSREGVVVVAACNNPRVLDPAIVRAGRLDHHIPIPLPDEAARAGILRTHLRGDLTADEFTEFVHEINGFTGADIARVIREARRVARRERRSLVGDDIRRLIPKKMMVPPAVLEATAIHEVGHAVVGSLLGFDLERLSIEASVTGRGRVLGSVAFIKDAWIRQHRDYYLDRIAIFLGGMAAEQVILGSHDAGSGGGAGSDLTEATRLAIAIESQFGMGASLATIGEFDEASLQAAHWNRGLMLRVEEILRKQLERATAMIEGRTAVVRSLALQLLARLEMEGDDVTRALDGYRDSDEIGDRP